VPKPSSRVVLLQRRSAVHVRNSHQDHEASRTKSREILASLWASDDDFRLLKLDPAFVQHPAGAQLFSLCRTAWKVHVQHVFLCVAGKAVVLPMVSKSICAALDLNYGIQSFCAAPSEYAHIQKAC